MTTFIKKIRLLNDQNQAITLIDNFARVEQTKSLVFDFNEMKHKFDAAGQGWVQRAMHFEQNIDVLDKRMLVTSPTSV